MDVQWSSVGHCRHPHDQCSNLVSASQRPPPPLTMRTLAQTGPAPQAYRPPSRQVHVSHASPSF
ncbi:hypothetical protein BD413DRAFT_4365 [Trametes elegans]|nr:hypothetical protein BD413DRAFT_4365 [Trametes elegans]